MFSPVNSSRRGSLELNIPQCAMPLSLAPQAFMFPVSGRVRKEVPVRSVSCKVVQAVHLHLLQFVDIKQSPSEKTATSLLRRKLDTKCLNNCICEMSYGRSPQ